MSEQENQDDSSSNSESERRKTTWLTEEQINTIAERAASVALTKVYTEVGKSVVKSFLYVIGASCIAASAWLAAHGFIK